MKSPKIALISPPQNHLTDPLKAEPLGLMYIEGALLKSGFDVNLVDMSFEKKLPEADIYGFSASTMNFPKIVEYAQQISHAKTIVGGPHASALPKQAKQFFNSVVVGPGEFLVNEIVSDLTKGIEGIYYGKCQNIDSIPIPPRPSRRTVSYSPAKKNSASLITSRGCPFQCAFCASNAVWGRSVSYRSLENVVQEIDFLEENYDIHSFKFVDDIFTLDRKRFRLFSDALSQKSISWFCEARVDSLHDDVLHQMIKSGCVGVDLGIESVDNNVLKMIHKNQTVEQVKKTIQKIRSYGLMVKMYLIYGLPFEPKDIVAKTIQFIEETNPDHVSLFTFTPYPGTEIYQNPDKFGITWIENNFSKYQHSVGENEDEQLWLPCIEYVNRSREFLRDERNVLKNFTIQWNNHGS
jgi:anaerobic magnesium-protoporphyrin IX monomethyl ester cyclase